MLKGGRVAGGGHISGAANGAVAALANSCASNNSTVCVEADERMEMWMGMGKGKERSEEQQQRGGSGKREQA